jgi:hypothetical protein
VLLVHPLFYHGLAIILESGWHHSSIAVELPFFDPNDLEAESISDLG